MFIFIMVLPLIFVKYNNYMAMIIDFFDTLIDIKPLALA